MAALELLTATAEARIITAETAAARSTHNPMLAAPSELLSAIAGVPDARTAVARSANMSTLVLKVMNVAPPAARVVRPLYRNVSDVPENVPVTILKHPSRANASPRSVQKTLRIPQMPAEL
ncbi:MAG TPA: hypothetical protein VGR43_01720 [Dehalococcoidia bacterium]|nr:hypothetical protein [Dehalococcoidia bacterium]